MSIEKEFLAEECGLDYDEYTSDKNLDLRDCTACEYFHQGYLCLEIGLGNFTPELPFYCSKIKLLEPDEIKRKILND